MCLWSNELAYECDFGVLVLQRVHTELSAFLLRILDIARAKQPQQLEKQNFLPKFPECTVLSTYYYFTESLHLPFLKCHTRMAGY
jgi:hypothetical protein